MEGEKRGAGGGEEVTKQEDVKLFYLDLFIKLICVHFMRALNVQLDLILIWGVEKMFDKIRFLSS